MREALLEVKAVEAHECEKAHPNMSHIEWVAQTKDAENQDKDPVGKQHENKEKDTDDAKTLQKKDHAKKGEARHRLEHKTGEPHDHPHDPVDPDVPESGEEDWTVDEAEARTSVGTKHKIKPQYNTKTHKLIVLPNGSVKVVPKSTPGMEAEETKKEEVEVDEAEMMQLKHKKSGQIMRVANKVYQKQAHIHRKRGWVPDSAQPYMKGGSAIQHSYEPEGDEHLQEAEFKVKIKGLPAFYMPGKSEATIRQELRKNVKNPKQIVSIERTTSAARKKDFRGRSQAK